jgi:hypothetical protein
MSYPALHQKTLRVDVCTTDRSHVEECLVRAASVCLSIIIETLPLLLAIELGDL